MTYKFDASDRAGAARHCMELLLSNDNDDYNESETRKDDIMALVSSMFGIIEMGASVENQIATIKESLVCAYLLGRRDEKAVPEAFLEE